MHEERLKHMKETLMCAVEMQLCNLGEVDTEELGEAIDMIKDLEEAIYYCTVTEAMKGNNTEMEFEMKKGGHHQEGENGESRMYYNGNRNYMPYNDSGMMYADDGRRRRADGTFYAENRGRNYAEGGQGGSSGGGGSSGSGSSGGGSSYADSGRSYNDDRNYMDDMMYRDSREGRSYNSRRMYMEAKDMKRDKATQLRELEKYMQELSQDIVEMIADASPEEKQYLEKKISALASKVGSMK